MRTSRALHGSVHDKAYRQRHKDELAGKVKARTDVTREQERVRRAKRREGLTALGEPDFRCGACGYPLLRAGYCDGCVYHAGYLDIPVELLGALARKPELFGLQYRMSVLGEKLDGQADSGVRQRWQKLARLRGRYGLETLLPAKESGGK